MLQSHLDMFWYLVGIAVICGITSIGLQRRTLWMWYLGWALMFVFAGYMGAVFVSGMSRAQDSNDVIHGIIYLGVGLTICVAMASGWSAWRSRFGGRKPPKPPADSPPPIPLQE